MLATARHAAPATRYQDAALFPGEHRDEGRGSTSTGLSSGAPKDQRRPIEAAFDPDGRASNLLFPMLLGVHHGCMVSVLSGVNRVRPRCVSMVGRLLVTPGLMMLCRFRVVPGGMRVMFRCSLVVFRSFLRHGIPP
jgi:hypothetical protein